MRPVAPHLSVAINCFRLLNVAGSAGRFAQHDTAGGCALLVRVGTDELLTISDGSYQLHQPRRLCALWAFALISVIGCGRSHESASYSQSATETPPERIGVIACASIETADGPSIGPDDANSSGCATNLSDEHSGANDGSPPVFELQAEDLARQAPVASDPETPIDTTDAKPDAAQDPPGMLLPWGPATPSTELTAVAQRAEQTARRGFNLAQRGAMFSARAQFVESLRILAQSLDEQRSTTAHTKALSAGLRALEEVNDLIPRDNGLDTDLNLKLIVDAHRTPVLKDRNLAEVTPADAQRLYLTYAQEQLAAAAGDQSVASLALHGLGKICVAPAEMHGPREQIAEAKAGTLYQAALIVEPHNFLAANELGVLLTRYGRLKEARTIFEQAVAVSDAPTTWRNLAAVCERLGDTTKASDAREEVVAAATRLQKTGYATAGMKYPIEWVAPKNSPTPVRWSPLPLRPLRRSWRRRQARIRPPIRQLRRPINPQPPLNRTKAFGRGCINCTLAK